MGRSGKLVGKVALVAARDRGLGQGIAEASAAEGAHLGIGFRAAGAMVEQGGPAPTIRAGFGEMADDVLASNPRKIGGTAPGMIRTGLA